MKQRDPLRDALDDLPRDIQPRRDLWPAIADRLDEPVAVPFWRRHLPTAGLLVAASLAVVLIAGLGDRGPAPQMIDVAAADTAVDSLDRDYFQIRTDLLQVLDHRCDQWTAAACDGLRSGLRELDRSADDLRLALSEAPAGSSEARRLATSYQRTLERARGLAGHAARL